MKIRRMIRSFFMLSCMSTLLCAGARDVTESVALDADADWTADDVVAISQGVTLDLAGHKLYLKSFSGAGTITDNVGGGELHVAVPESQTLVNSSVVLSGSLKLVLDGAGTFVAAKQQQTYSGGTDVLSGTVAMPGPATQAAPNCQSLYNLPNAFGAAPQGLVIRTGATLETNGNYDFHMANVVLDGGTVVNNGRDFGVNDEQRTYGGSAMTGITKDSSAILNYSYLWRNKDCDLGGKTLTVTLADGKYFYLGGNKFSNGTVVFADNNGSNSGCIYAYEGNDSKTTTFDVRCRMQVLNDLSVSDFVFRSGALANNDNAAHPVKVYGTFTPESDQFPSVALQDGARLNLTAKSGVWSANASGDYSGCCGFAPNATIVIDVTGRTLSQGDQVVAWTSLPQNAFNARFMIDDGSGTLVAGSRTMHGVFYGGDSDSTEIATAEWTGAIDKDISKPGNWTCRNAAGVVLDGRVPASDTLVLLSGAVAVTFPAGAGLSGLVVSCELSDDCDFRGFTILPGSGATIDVKGHKLRVVGLGGISSVTSSVDGGELHVDVADNAILENTDVALTGSLALHKNGGGIFVATKSAQTYTGGTFVHAGTIRPGTAAADLPFGSKGASVELDGDATFDDAGKAMSNAYKVRVGDNCTLAVHASATSGTPSLDDFQLNGDAIRVDGTENEMRLTTSAGNSHGSAFWKKPFNPRQPWRASFDYSTVNPNNPADGFTFMLQGDSRGASALGGTGGSLAAEGISPSIGCAYSIWTNGGQQGEGAGWIENGARVGMGSVANGIVIRDGIHVVVEHDGHGTVVQTITQGTGDDARTSTLSRFFDISSWPSTAWAGFTAACGGSYCEQHVSGFTIEPMPFADTEDNFDLTPAASSWKFNMNTVLDAVGDEPAIRLTDALGNQAGSATYLTPLPVATDFEISGTYIITSGSGSPADGGAFLFHANDTSAYGETGGARGFAGNNGLTTAVGWAFNIYVTERMDFISMAEVKESANIADSGVSLRSMKPVDFKITYKGELLTITLSQTVGEELKTFTASHSVNLEQYFGKKYAYFAVTGSTGGENAKQLVYNFKYSHGRLPREGLNGLTARMEEDSTVDVKLSSGIEMAYVAELEFADDASVTVGASGLANAPYVLDIAEVHFSKSGESASPSISITANGSASGELRIGSVVLDELGSVLRINSGSLSGEAGAPIRIDAPDFRGTAALLDLSQVQGASSSGFTLKTPSGGVYSLRIENGILYATYGKPCVIYMR